MPGLKPNCHCVVCGKPTYRTPKRIAFGERITCSFECRKSLGYADGKPRELADRTCGVCGKAFRPTARLSKYCSRECHYIAHKAEAAVELICDTCGKHFTRHPYEVQRHGNLEVAYCSRECSAESQRRRVTGNCAYCGEETWLHEGYVGDERHPNGLMFCSRAHHRMYQLQMKGPNGLEVDFATAFPELRFTGDGQFYINDAIGPFCPDFVSPDQDKAVELFGDYWHRNDDPEDRIARFRSKGWQCLVIWESEFRGDLENVRLRVAEFLQK